MRRLDRLDWWVGLNETHLAPDGDEQDYFVADGPWLTWPLWRRLLDLARAETVVRVVAVPATVRTLITYRANIRASMARRRLSPWRVLEDVYSSERIVRGVRLWCVNRYKDRDGEWRDFAGRYANRRPLPAKLRYALTGK